MKRFYLPTLNQTETSLISAFVSLINQANRRWRHHFFKNVNHSFPVRCGPELNGASALSERLTPPDIPPHPTRPLDPHLPLGVVPPEHAVDRAGAVGRPDDQRARPALHAHRAAARHVAAARRRRRRPQDGAAGRGHQPRGAGDRGPAHAHALGGARERQAGGESAERQRHLVAAGRGELAAGAAAAGAHHHAVARQPLQG